MTASAPVIHPPCHCPTGLELRIEPRELDQLGPVGAIHASLLRAIDAAVVAALPRVLRPAAALVLSMHTDMLVHAGVSWDLITQQLSSVLGAADVGADRRNAAGSDSAVGKGSDGDSNDGELSDAIGDEPSLQDRPNIIFRFMPVPLGDKHTAHMRIGSHDAAHHVLAWAARLMPPGAGSAVQVHVVSPLPVAETCGTPVSSELAASLLLGGTVREVRVCACVARQARAHCVDPGSARRVPTLQSSHPGAYPWQAWPN